MADTKPEVKIVHNELPYDPARFETKYSTKVVEIKDCEVVTQEQADRVNYKRTKSVVVEVGSVIRLVTGPVSHSYIAVAVYAMLTMIAIASWTCVWQAPDDLKWTYWLQLALTAATITSGLITTCTDPGIVNPSPFEHKLTDVNKEEVYEDYLSMSEDELNYMKSVGMLAECSLYYRSRSCETCSKADRGGFDGFQRPPKSSHCQVCNNCVRGYDHHCNLLNNCIGKRNMRVFCCFLAISLITAIVTIALCAY